MSSKVFRIYDVAVIPAGFVLGGVMYLVAAILDALFLQPHLRVPGTPYLSSGQQFGLVMWPLSCLLGAVQGWSVALAARKSFLVAAATAGGAAVLCAAFVGQLWASNFVRYGPDPSDVILYVVPLTATALMLIWSIAMSVLAARARLTPAAGRR